MKEEGSTSTASVSLIQETRAVEEDFIKAYKNLPELWDTDHKHYTNKYKRSEAIDVLLQIMKRWNPSVNCMNVRRKINILRSTYRKDKKKYLASKYVGQNGEEIYEYEPRNWKFHALKFLDKDNNNEIAEINMDDTNFDDETSYESAPEDDELLSQSSDVLASITEDEPPTKRRLRANKMPNKFVKIEIEDDYYEQNEELLDRELDAIGANVTCKLKRMNSLQRYRAELLINKVLITGLKNNLSDDTDLS